MNKHLYKKIVIAMMITTIGTVAASAAEPEAKVVPVDLTQAELHTDKKVAVLSPKKQAAKATANQKVRPVDVTPELREQLAQQIAGDAEKSSQKWDAKNVEDPVLVIGKVASNQNVDLTLPKTVQMALDYNRSIKIAHYDLKSAEYAIDEARAGKMPQVDYTFNGGRGVKTHGLSAANSFSNGLSINIPLYTGGEVEGAIAKAKIGKTSAQETILQVEQATKLSAIEGYFGLLAYKELQDVYHEAVDNLQGHLNNVQAQYQVGTVAKLDVLTSNVSLANAKTTAVTSDTNVATSEANLNNILGLPLQTNLVLTDHRLPFDAYNISLEEAIDYAMKYNPEVLQATLDVRTAEENIGIAESGNRPTVSVGASNVWSDDSFPGAENRTWKVIGSVTYSFYDGGATNAKIKSAKQSLLAARETEQQTRESIQLTVKQTYLDLNGAAQKVQATQASVDEAEEAFKIARVRYQAGVGINLDVLDAQLDLNEARTNYIQALYDYNIDIAKLEQAMGVDVRSGVIHPSLTAANTNG